jgi:hypothetical protein
LLVSVGRKKPCGGPTLSQEVAAQSLSNRCSPRHSITSSASPTGWGDNSRPGAFAGKIRPDLYGQSLILGDRALVNPHDDLGI